MGAVVVLVVMLAGYAWLFGHRSAAVALLRSAAKHVFVALTALYTAAWLTRKWPGVASGDFALRQDLLYPALGIALFTLFGFVMWRTREARGRLREARARRHAAPRDRHLPAPPVDRSDP